MANEPADKGSSIMQSVTRMLDSAVDSGGYESLINVLSLICLVSILSRNQGVPAVQAAAPASSANPLHKLIGDLSKGEGGLGPETLVSLLPLLNNPQIKSKINPGTIAAVMSLIGGMGDKSDKGDKDKSDKADKEKGEKVEKDKSDKVEEKAEVKRAPPPPPPTAATVTSIEALAEKQEPAEGADGEKRSLGRYLNWKGNF